MSVPYPNWNSEEQEAGRHIRQLDYQIERAAAQQYQRRLNYIEQQFPAQYAAGKAATDLAVLMGGVGLLAVLPLLGVMWLGDALDDVRWLIGATVAFFVVALVFQAGRVHQSVKDHQSAVIAMWEQLNKAGWPALTEEEEAAHRNTTPARLLELAHSSDVSTLMRAGDNPNMPPAGLELLANHPDSTVRLRAAWSNNTPLQTLQRLAEDPDPDVREAAQKALTGGGGSS